MTFGIGKLLLEGLWQSLPLFAAALAGTWLFIHLRPGQPDTGGRS